MSITKKWLSLSLVAMFVALVANSAVASITPSDFIRGINELEDDDFEGAILASPPTLELGDVVYGIYRIQSLNDPFTATPIASDPAGPGTTFTGRFATTVTSKAAGGSGFLYGFGAVTDPVWDGLFGAGTRSSSSTAVSVHQDSTTPRIVVGDLTSPDGPLLFEFGFVGPGTMWTADVNTDDFSAGSLDGDFELALNEISNSTFIDLDTHDFLGLGVKTDLQGAGTFEQFGPGAGGLTPIRSDTNFYVNVVPEPISAIVWGSLALLGTASVRRRNR